MRRLSIVTLLVCACAGGADDAASGLGRVQASLTAAPGSQGMGRQLGVREIIVTVDKVTAHSNTAGWVALSPGDVRVDILKLADSAAALGFQNLPAGKVTQLRLYVKEGAERYVTRDDGTRVDLKVPSGIESGIKLHGMFDVAGCQLTNVPLQLDGKKSIWVHPTGGEDLWILRPVIRTGHIDATGMPCVPPTPGGSGGGPGSGTGGGPGTGTGGGPAGTGGGGINEGPGSGGTGGSGGMGIDGAMCSIGSNCLSGVCLQGVCQKGGADAPCNTNDNCVSAMCVAGACAPGNAVGAGGQCTTNSGCLSGACVNGTCDPGGQGKPCVAAADCTSAFVCTAGYCQPQIN